MSTDKNARQSEAMAKHLQEKLRRRRLPVGAVVWAALLLSIGFLCWFAWWIWSSPPPARLTLVAYDHLTADASVSLKGRLVAVESDKPAQLGGNEILFLNGQVPQGGDAQFGKTKTGDDGQATWQGNLLDGLAQGDFGVRLLGSKIRSELNDRAMVFRAPETSGLLFVEITGVLTIAQADEFRKNNLFNIAAKPEAGAFLRKLLGKEVQVIYLSPRGAEPLLYQKMRGWIREQISNAQSGFPAGPVLSWDGAKDLSEVALKFRGAKRGIVMGDEAVAGLRELGAEIMPMGLMQK